MLEVQGISVRFGTVQVLWDVSLQAGSGEITCILGSNGAGKSTVMNSVSGLVRPFTGAIRWEGREIQAMPVHRRVEVGVAHVPERRRVFPQMSVLENLLLGGHIPRARSQREDSLQRVFELFPILHERRHQMAGTFSGGQQQMLAIGRGLMSAPSLLMLDEPFLGLSPTMVREILAVMHRLRHQGLAVLFIEQAVRASLEISDRAYVMENGRVAISGPGSELLQDDRVQRVYLGRL